MGKPATAEPPVEMGNFYLEAVCKLWWASFESKRYRLDSRPVSGHGVTSVRGNDAS